MMQHLLLLFFADFSMTYLGGIRELCATHQPTMEVNNEFWLADSMNLNGFTLAIRNSNYRLSIPYHVCSEQML